MTGQATGRSLTVSSDELTLTLKRPSPTRPWRSFYDVYHSFSVSYEDLRRILHTRDMEYRLLPVSPELLKELVDFFRHFNSIFDYLEMSDKPSIQNVIPSYYLMKEFGAATLNVHESRGVILLKEYFLSGLDEKYWSSTTELHKVATVMDPTFRQLSFIEDRQFRNQFIENVKIHITSTLSSYIKIKPTASESTVSTEVPPKITKIDPFSNFRSSCSAAPVSLHSSNKLELLQEFENYMNENFHGIYSTNPLDFWKKKQSTYPLLSEISRKIFVIQASSGESERHFSIGGSVLTASRNRLDPSTVDSLVVLKEGDINGLWQLG